MIPFLIKLIFSAALVVCWFVCKACSVLIFLIVELLHWFPPRETYFGHGIYCVLIFARGTCSTSIFLSVKLVYCFSSSWNRFCSWNFLCVDFYLLNLLRANFCLWNFWKYIFYFRFLISIIFTWECFVRGICCLLIFCSWNFLHVYFSLRKTCKLICIFAKLSLFMEILAY